MTGNTTSGVEDATTAPSVYYQNTSYNNGPSGTTNYVGALFSPAVACGGFSTAAAPIRLWDLPNPPCNFNNHQVVGDNLDNLDITN